MGTRVINARKALTAVAIAVTSIGCVAALAASPAQAAKPVKPTPTPTAPSLPTYTTTVVGTSPQALTQSTPEGKTIRDLALDGGKFYVGYGDYNANTGPIKVTTFDPATGAFAESGVTAPTEEISVYRKISGKMYAPWTDPNLAWTANVGYSTNATGAWTNQFKAPAVHVYDVATLNGSDLWMVGSAGATDPENKATAYRSTDGGATWVKVAEDDSVTTNGYERYYWAAAINGKMYLQAEAVNEGSVLRVFDGTTWSAVSGTHPCYTTEARSVEVFNNKIVCANYTYGLNTFDGAKTSTFAGTGYVRDLAVPGDGYIYALGTSGIFRSADGVNWTGLAAAPTNASSIGVYNGSVYLGMYLDATIVKVNGLSVAAAPAPAPTTATPTPTATTTTPVACKGNSKRTC